MEDGSCHERLLRDIAAFADDPHETPRPIPQGLVDEPDLMIGMDQFKDIAGFARYASRLDVGLPGAIAAWLAVGFDETVGGYLGVKLGPTRVERAACDPDVVARHTARELGSRPVTAPAA